MKTLERRLISTIILSDIVGHPRQLFWFDQTRFIRDEVGQKCSVLHQLKSQLVYLDHQSSHNYFSNQILALLHHCRIALLFGCRHYLPIMVPDFSIVGRWERIVHIQADMIDLMVTCRMQRWMN